MTNIDDPRLTAYALGELDEKERAEVEARLKGDAAACAEVEAIRGMAAHLKSELAGAGSPRLEDAQRKSIEGAAGGRRRGVVGMWVRVAVAASVLVVVGRYVFGPTLVERPNVMDGSGRRDVAVGPRAGVEKRSGAEIKALPPVSVNEPRLDSDLADQLSPLGYTGGSGVSLSASSAPRSKELSSEDITLLRALGYVGGGGASAVEIVEAELVSEPDPKPTVPSVFATRKLGGGGSAGRMPSNAATIVDKFPSPGTESYESIAESGFRDPRSAPLSTFSIDVDTASYANVRRFLNDGRLPPMDAVRVEELINAFTYSYAAPESDPVALHVDATSCPWQPQHRLVRVALQARPPVDHERPAAHLVFLIDTSGSMESDDKLPLLKSAMRLLVGTLDERDTVGIVTYNNNAAVALSPTSCADRSRILSIIDGLFASGGTNGEAGLRTAYQFAGEHSVKGDINRVFLATDGDFNIGATSRDELEGLITSSAKSGVFLTVLGFGTGNLKDSNLELLADKGNGHYVYIDSLDEGRRVLVEQAGSTLEVVAKDVKIQVEFNPGRVAAYRLIGYENRALAAQDFNDDRKDAGEMGAGHSVTALYEVVPAGAPWPAGVDDLKYQKPAEDVPAPELVDSDELLTAKLRWKEPEGDTSRMASRVLIDEGGEADGEFRFAAAVATFGMLLRGSDASSTASYDDVLTWARANRGEDEQGYRAEFIRLAEIAKGLSQP